MGCKVSTNTPTCLCDAAVPQATCHQPSSRDLISGCKETQSAWLNTLVLESNSVTTMARSECAWFSQCVISLRSTTSPFLLLLSPFLPFSNFLEKNKHRLYCQGLTSEHCRTLRAFIAMQIVIA